MWLIPFTRGSTHTVEIDLGSTINTISALRVWNYNKGESSGNGAWNEDVPRGVRLMSIFVDERLVGKCELRMGPGFDGVYHAQLIILRNVQRGHSRICPGISFAESLPRQLRYVTPLLKQDYEVPVLPTGLLWKIVFHDNWNDGYYIGLDQIELFDVDGKKIEVLSNPDDSSTGSTPNAGAFISAVPHSLNDLDDSFFASSNPADSSRRDIVRVGDEWRNVGSLRDPRTPDQLFVNSPPNARGADAARHPWLCPLSRCMTAEERERCARRLLGSSAEVASLRFPVDNTLFIMFQYPVCLSSLRFFNYSKTPSRGVRLDFL
jgi:hypothetical protein